jgi:hypothetical protein
MTKQNGDELKRRVSQAKLKLKAKGYSRSEFFDNVYGALFDKQHMKIDNLWSCRNTDQEFTENLEGYVKQLKTKK